MFAALQALKQEVEVYEKRENSLIDEAVKDISTFLDSRSIQDVGKEYLYKVLSNPELQDENAIKIFAEKIYENGYRLPESIIQLIKDDENLSVNCLRAYLYIMQVELPDIESSKDDLLVKRVKALESSGRLSLDDFEPIIGMGYRNRLARNGLYTNDFRIYSHLSREFFLSYNVRNFGEEKVNKMESILRILGYEFIKKGTVNDSIITRAILQPRPDKNPISVAQAFDIFNITGLVNKADIISNIDNVIAQVRNFYKVPQALEPVLIYLETISESES
jgi:hypothetical protein